MLLTSEVTLILGFQVIISFTVINIIQSRYFKIMGKTLLSREGLGPPRRPRLPSPRAPQPPGTPKLSRARPAAAMRSNAAGDPRGPGPGSLPGPHRCRRASLSRVAETSVKEETGRPAPISTRVCSDLHDSSASHGGAGSLSKTPTAPFEKKGKELRVARRFAFRGC